MVLLWLLKMISGIGLYGFVIESKLFLVQHHENFNHLNPTHFYHSEELVLLYHKRSYQSPLTSQPCFTCLHPLFGLCTLERLYDFNVPPSIETYSAA